MTTFAPDYRFVLYASRAVDPTEATVLTAGGTAFQVSTLAGDTGYAPYMNIPEIRRGSLNPLDKHVTTGQATVEILDTRLASTNAARWFTQFLGNAKGRNQLKGCLGYVSESIDGGTTWTPFFVGRVDTAEMPDLLHGRLTLYDLADDMLNIDCFSERAHSSVSYAIEPTVLPLGLTAQYASIAAVTPMTATVGAAAYVPNTNVRILTLDATSQTRADNILIAALLAEFGVMIPTATSATAYSTGVGIIGPPGSLRCRFSYAGGGITNKELQVVQLFTVRKGGSSFPTNAQFSVTAIGVTALTKPDGSANTGDPYYSAFDSGTVPDASSVTFTLRMTQLPQNLSINSTITGPRGLGDPNLGIVQTYAVSGSFAAQGGVPALMLGDTDLMTVFGDVLDGDFSPLIKPGDYIPAGKAIGDQKYPIPYDNTAASWTNLSAAPSGKPALPKVRFILPQAIKRGAFLEQQFGQVFGIGYRFQPKILGGKPVSACVPVDLRLPVAADVASIPVITDADLDAANPPSWSDARASVVSDLYITWYIDHATDAVTAAATGQAIPAINPQLITPVEQQVRFLSLGQEVSVGVGSRPFSITALGIRGTPVQEDSLLGMFSGHKAEREANGVRTLYEAVFGAGAAEISLTLHRTANTTGLWMGDYFFCQATALPSPATNQRGDTLICLLTERNDRGPVIEARAIVCGAGAGCSVPTIGTPTQTSGNVNHSISVVITPNAASDPVEWRFLVDVTAALTVAPNDNDQRWTFAGRVTATGTAILNNLPSACRIFVEARSVSASTASTAAIRLPSAYVQPSGTKYVATGTIGAPTSVAVLPSPILTTSTIVASWANTASGSAALRVQILLDSVIVITLPAGSTTIILNPYATTSSHTYTLDVRYLDELTGVSTSGTTTFTTPAAFVGPTLTAPGLALA